MSQERTLGLIAVVPLYIGNDLQVFYAVCAHERRLAVLQRINAVAAFRLPGAILVAAAEKKIPGLMTGYTAAARGSFMCGCAETITIKKYTSSTWHMGIIACD